MNQHIRDAKWHRVGSRAIITGTRHAKTNETKQGKGTQRSQINETQQAPGALKEQIVQNDLEYADDTHLLLAKDTHDQLWGEIGNYDIATETGELNIQWGKVLIPTQRTKTNGETATSF